VDWETISLGSKTNQGQIKEIKVENASLTTLFIPTTPIHLFLHPFKASEQI
jgi:uncharacterized membrane protein